MDWYAFQKPKQYKIDDFKYNKVEEIQQLEYDYDYYKKQFGDKMDDEMLVLFDMVENADMSKKEVRIMGQMLKKMYQEKYKNVETIFMMKCDDIKAEDLKGEFKPRIEDCDLKIEEIQIKEDVDVCEVDDLRYDSLDSKNPKRVEKQKEFNEENFKGFYDIVHKMEKELEE